MARHGVFAAPERSTTMSQILIIFATVFLAELADKTQLATVMFAAERRTTPLWVFAAAAAALVASSALAVGLGIVAERYLAMLPLKLIAGCGFIVLGLWSIWSYLRAAPAA